MLETTLNLQGTFTFEIFDEARFSSVGLCLIVKRAEVVDTVGCGGGYFDPPGRRKETKEAAKEIFHHNIEDGFIGLRLEFRVIVEFKNSSLGQH